MPSPFAEVQVAQSSQHLQGLLTTPEGKNIWQDKIYFIFLNLVVGMGKDGCRALRECKVQVAGHCFTITKTTHTFTKMLTYGLKHYLKHIA